MNKRYVQIRHRSTGAVIAAGPAGYGITPFEGNYYIRRRYLREGHFRADYIADVRVYKELYIGLNCIAPDQTVSRHLGWMYWLPNLLLRFIMFRVAIPAAGPRILIEFVNARPRSRRSHADPISVSARPRFLHTG